MTDLEKRLARVERNNRRLGAAVLFLVLGMVAALTVAMGDTKPKVYSVVDLTGKERARLGIASGAPGLWFYSQGGAKRLFMGLDAEDNPVIQLYTGSGSPGYFVNLSGAGRGASTSAAGMEFDPQSSLVCTTGKNSKTYHRCERRGEGRCSDMEPGFPKMMTLDEAKKRGLKPCERCFPDK